MTSPAVSPLLRLRRGLGALYLASGLLNWALMGLAVSAAPISAAVWSRLYFGQYLLLVVAGPMYLLFGFWQQGRFLPAAFIDYIVGIPPFVLLISVIFPFLAGGGAKFMAFLPGALLAAYGAGLLSGRAVGFRKKLEF